jgi:hypothetical protein
MAAATMSPGSAFRCVDVDNTARLDTQMRDKESLLHLTFNKNLLAVALQVLCSYVNRPCKTTNVHGCAAFKASRLHAAHSQRLKHSL